MRASIRAPALNSRAPSPARTFSLWPRTATNTFSACRARSIRSGGGCDVPGLIAELDEAKPDALRVLVESPGGLVSYGLALYSDLAARRREGMALRTEARGIVASAAVLPFLAAEGDDRTMSDGSLLMVHEVWGGFFFAGPADDLEKESSKQVKAMRAMTTTYAGIVQKATALSAAAVKAPWPKRRGIPQTKRSRRATLPRLRKPKPPTTRKSRARIASQARAALSHTFYKGVNPMSNTLPAGLRTAVHPATVDAVMAELESKGPEVLRAESDRVEEVLSSIFKAAGDDLDLSLDAVGALDGLSGSVADRATKIVELHSRACGCRKPDGQASPGIRGSQRNH